MRRTQAQQCELPLPVTASVTLAAIGDADRGRPTGDVGKSAGPARAVAYGGRERRGQA